MSTKSKIVGVMFPLVFILIGTGIAFAVYSFGDKEKFDSKIAYVNAAEMQWVYLSAFVFSYLVLILNFYPMGHKATVMRGKSGNLRANMFIYKMAAEG